MSQASDETRRKFVLVFIAPAEGEKALDGLVSLLERGGGWKLESKHILPLSARIHIEEGSVSR